MVNKRVKHTLGLSKPITPENFYRDIDFYQKKLYHDFKSSTIIRPNFSTYTS
ncbi:MAG: hypothetical protein K0R82_299 [Flavipsychrobacter sp.]|jgi:hypothetical protein|nr:hypothetical protein [Flavipsychrobacter sp.]